MVFPFGLSWARTQRIATPLRSVADIRRPVSLRSAASLQFEESLKS